MENTLTGKHVDTLTEHKNARALKAVRDSYEAKHRHLLTEAKAEILRISRADMCADWNVKCEENRDDEGGGSIRLTFPSDWSTDQAERFASHFLDMDLSSQYRGPGQYFQDGSSWRHKDTGEVIISITWGLDI